MLVRPSRVTGAGFGGTLSAATGVPGRAPVVIDRAKGYTPPGQMPSSILRRAERLRRLRMAEGLGQDEIGALLGVSSEEVARWERGVTIPVHHLDALAARLGVSVEWLLAEERPATKARRRPPAAGRFTREGPHRLGRLRRAEGLTPDALGAAIGVAGDSVRGWEAGEEIPAAHHAALAARLGVDVTWLLGRESYDSSVEPADEDDAPPPRALRFGV